MRVVALVVSFVLASAAVAAPPCTVTLSGAIAGTRPCTVGYTKYVPGSWTLGTADGNTPFEFHALLGVAKAFAPGVYTFETLANGGVNASNPAADNAGMMWSATAPSKIGGKARPAVGQVKLTLTAVGEDADCHGELTATMVPAGIGAKSATGTVTVVAKF